MTIHFRRLCFSWHQPCHVQLTQRENQLASVFILALQVKMCLYACVVRVCVCRHRGAAAFSPRQSLLLHGGNWAGSEGCDTYQTGLMSTLSLLRGSEFIILSNIGKESVWCALAKYIFVLAALFNPVLSGGAKKFVKVAGCSFSELHQFPPIWADASHRGNADH